VTWTSHTLLTLIAQAGENGMRVNDLAAQAGLTRQSVDSAMDRLRNRGLIHRPPASQTGYTLTDAGRGLLAAGKLLKSGPKGGHTGPRAVASGARGRIWRAMRIRSKFTADELAVLAATGPENVRKYLNGLARVDYVRPMPRREAPGNPSSNGRVRWALLRDTGPAAPSVNLEKGVVTDPNTGARLAMADPVAEPSRKPRG
jgi:DNA-binding MarR family transcriptional regulator